MLAFLIRPIYKVTKENKYASDSVRIISQIDWLKEFGDRRNDRDFLWNKYLWHLIILGYFISHSQKTPGSWSQCIIQISQWIFENFTCSLRLCAGGPNQQPHMRGMVDYHGEYWVMYEALVGETSMGGPHCF